MAGSRRNYKAMLTPKLLRAIAELDGGYGDAYERCVRKGADPRVDLAIAQGEARDRGHAVTPNARPPVRPAAPVAAESYADLVDRVQTITGLNGRQASVIAASFPDGTSPDRQQIARKAEALGYQPGTNEIPIPETR